MSARIPAQSLFQTDSDTDSASVLSGLGHRHGYSVSTRIMAECQLRIDSDNRFVSRNPSRISARSKRIRVWIDFDISTSSAFARIDWDTLSGSFSALHRLGYLHWRVACSV